MNRLAYIVVLILVFSLCGCAAESEPYSHGIIVTYATDDSVNGYRLHTDTQSTDSTTDTTSSKTETVSSTSSSTQSSDTSSTAKVSDGIYYASVNSKKFHLSYCGSVKRIKEENLITAGERQEFIDKGLEPCQSCNP